MKGTPSLSETALDNTSKQGKDLNSVVGGHGKYLVILSRHMDVNHWSCVASQHTCWFSRMEKEQMNTRQF